jgi:hypothetical protein
MIGFQEIGCQIVFDIKINFSDDLFECCFKGQCLTWFHACSAQQTGHDGL